MIVTADTGNPVVGALVILSFDPWEYRSTTDAGGWYRFADLPVGTYGVIVQKTGYQLSAAVGGNAQLPLTSALRQLRGVVVTEGQPARVDFKMMPLGTISGVVRDEQGEPIQGVTISLLVPSYSDQVFRLQGILGTRTDDEGRYRLDNLSHRDYYLQAAVQRNSLFGRRHGAGTVYPPTFFPTAIDLPAAQRVSVNEALAEARADFSLMPISASEITGLAVNSRGEPLAGEMLVVEHPLFRRGDIRTRIGPDGRFRIEAVPPGTYVLKVQASCCGAEKMEFGYAVVTAAPTSRTDVQLVTQPEVVVSGRIVRSTSAPAPALIMVKAIPIDLPLAPMATGVVAPDGTFEFRMHPVLSRIEIGGLEPGWYASLTVAGRQLGGREIDARAGMPIRDVLVTLSSRVAHLRGAVTQAGGGGNERILVAVFSIDQQHAGTPRFADSTYAEVSGQFEFSNMEPGDYAVVAVRGFAPIDLQDPAFRASVRTDGTMVTLREAESKSITMRVAGIAPRP
jgi:hypothetical protein